jgi:hypothetical protein
MARYKLEVITSEQSSRIFDPVPPKSHSVVLGFFSPLVGLFSSCVAETLLRTGGSIGYIVLYRLLYMTAEELSPLNNEFFVIPAQGALVMGGLLV